MENEKHVAILVHGIRDYAQWQTAVRKSLEDEKLAVETINYGRFDVFRFLIPIPYFRNVAINSVAAQTRDIQLLHPSAALSFIAHSFGTYVLANVLRRNFELKFHRIVFCGSVLKYDFPFEQISTRFSAPILNEVGAKDAWPAVAESVTWGYGSAGTYGFRRPRVRDRWHLGAGHAFFLDSDFCRKFWVPFLRDGTVVEGAAKAEPPPISVRALSLFRLKYAIPAVAMLLAGVAFRPDPKRCFPFELLQEKPDRAQPARECRKGQVTFLKWIDRSDYKAVDHPTGRWPNNRANRALSLQKIESDGTPVWGEKNLLRVDQGKSYWQPPPLGGWIEIVSDSDRIVSGQRGSLFRRQPSQPDCKSTAIKENILEAFVRKDIANVLADGTIECGDGLQMGPTRLL